MDEVEESMNREYNHRINYFTSEVEKHENSKKKETPRHSDEIPQVVSSIEQPLHSNKTGKSNPSIDPSLSLGKSLKRESYKENHSYQQSISHQFRISQNKLDSVEIKDGSYGQPSSS